MPRRQHKNGFTLVETLVACAILVIVCGALLTINLVITKNLAFARGRAIAYNLAAEGIEGARQIRETNLIDGQGGTNWNTFVCNNATAPYLRKPTISGSTITYYTLTSGTFSNCYGTNPIIIFVPDANSHGEDISVGGLKFNRKIYFVSSGVNPPILDPAGQDTTEDNAIRIVVDINWTEGVYSRSVEVRELLTNWKRGI